MNLSVVSKKIQQYPILFVCVLVLILSLALLFMRGPKIKVYDDELANLQREWQNIQKNIERSSSLAEQTSTLEAGEAALRERLMDADQVASNYEFIYSLERASGTVLGQFVQGVPTDGSKVPTGTEAYKNFRVVPFDIPLTGTLPQILTFVDMLNTESFVVRVDSMNITLPGTTTSTPDSLNARIRFEVLASKPK